MPIKQDQVVAIKYSASINNEVVDNNIEEDAPLFFMYGRGQMMPGLESRIADMNIGDSSELEIPAAEAYGEYNPEAIQDVPKEHLAHLELHEGLVLQGQGENGEPVMVVVKEVHDETVVMDYNHPMAGQDVSFSVTIQDVRDPSEQELSTGIAAENQQQHHHEGGCCGGGHKDGEHASDDEGSCCGGGGHKHGEHASGDEGSCCGGDGHKNDEDGCCGDGHGHGHSEHAGKEGGGCGCH